MIILGSAREDFPEGLRKAMVQTRRRAPFKLLRIHAQKLAHIAGRDMLAILVQLRTNSKERNSFSFFDLPDTLSLKPTIGA